MLPALLIMKHYVIEYEKIRKNDVIFRSKPIKMEWGVLVLFEDTSGNLIQPHEIINYVPE